LASPLVNGNEDLNCKFYSRTMLDLAKIAGQIPGMSQHLRHEVAASSQRLQRARSLLQHAQTQQTELGDRYRQWRDSLLFTVPLPVEPLDTCLPIQPPPSRYSVFATDGSQIAPSHHEIVYCYLLNVGRVMLHYGQNLHPLLDSQPEIYYKPDDLYQSRQWGIRIEDWMGYRRTVLEAESLAELACRWVNPPGAHGDPNLALVDGSLIYWFVEGLPQDARDRILNPMLAAWEALRLARIPLLGYISSSRSQEGLNFLRLAACPHENPNCAAHCGELEINATPCQVFEPLRDGAIWKPLLAPGQRSPLWQSNQRILDCYEPAQRVYFCYVNVGTEIARVEVPAWVAEDRALFDRSLSILLAQVDKGYGYPVALAEAHNQAVIRGGDRARFFALIEQQLIRAGMQDVGASYKEVRKRGSIA
jgi:hypothetical protein